MPHPRWWRYEAMCCFTQCLTPDGGGMRLCAASPFFKGIVGIMSLFLILGEAVVVPVAFS